MIERLLAAERALGAGDLDQADRLFGQVAEADDRNAIAVAGRAKVALARGDVAAARRLAERALAIDPDEAAAARLLAGTPEGAGVTPPPPGVVTPPVEATPPPPPATPPVGATQPAPPAAPPSLGPAPATPAPLGRRLLGWLRRLLGRRP